jgi:hypothetical protein
MTETRMQALESRHSDQDAVLSELSRHPSVDALELAAVKRRKLSLRDAMERTRRN